MRVFKTKWFDNWARKKGIKDKALINAVEEIGRGLADASLGGHVFKKRVSLPGQGKRGGARILIAYRSGEMAFILDGYAKNEKTNIGEHEFQALKLHAARLLGLSEASLVRAVEKGELKEVRDNG